MSRSKQDQVTPRALVRVAPRTLREVQNLTATVNFRALFINHPEPMWVYDLKTLHCLEINEAAVERYGYSRSDFLSTPLTDIHPPEDVPNVVEDVARTRAGVQHSGEWRHLHKDGRVIDVEVICHGVAFGGSEAQVVVVHDITKRRQAEQALRHAERKYQLIFEEAIVGMYQSTPDGRLLSANPAMARMFGFDSPGELITSLTKTQFHPYVDPARREEFERLLRDQGVVNHFELQIQRKNGSKVWLWTSAQAVRQGKTIVRYEGIFEDITDRKLLEEQLLQAQQKYRDIVENAVIGIFQSTPEGRYITVNPALAAMLGYDSPEDLMATITDFTQQVYVNPRSRAEFKRLAKEQGAATNFESQAYRKDGSKVWICANVWAVFKDGVVVGYEGMNEDVTQRKLLEEELLQAQKMEAVGQLTSGIAHDFNNALSIVMGYSDLLRMRLPGGDLSQKYVEQIATAGRRANALTRQLLAFSRKQVIQPVVLDLNAITSEFEKMMRRLIGEDIEITFQRSPELGRVKMDPGQVEQILMNLVVNSRDAMPDGGRLCIETANVELDETYAHQTVHLCPGPYVMLTVSDTGCGMDEKTLLHIFEPFFTTKEVGKGTGLGLSTVYGIVKQNGGHVSAYSVPGEGTTFRLYLPRISETAKVSGLPQAFETIPLGTETVLIVEDEEPLRMLARICLESNGYRVLDAPNAAAALELAKKHNGRIHLLLTDVVMPGMSGRELAECLAAQREVTVMYMSGYNNVLIDHHGILERDTVLLEKPFTRQSLLTKVYEALHTSQAKLLPLPVQVITSRRQEKEVPDKKKT
jgi:two-component system, cell cycle sensor histidine kinase and response regulator CckA